MRNRWEDGTEVEGFGRATALWFGGFATAAESLSNSISLRVDWVDHGLSGTGACVKRRALARFFWDVLSRIWLSSGCLRVHGPMIDWIRFLWSGRFHSMAATLVMGETSAIHQLRRSQHSSCKWFQKMAAKSVKKSCCLTVGTWRLRNGSWKTGHGHSLSCILRQSGGIRPELRTHRLFMWMNRLDFLAPPLILLKCFCELWYMINSFIYM